METQHAGKAALAKILADTKTNHLGFLAIQYLAERLDSVEKQLAERNRAFNPPLPEEVSAYASSIRFALDGCSFCDYYAARNWCVGKVKMKDWKAAVRTWKSRRDAEAKPTGRIPDNLRTDHGL